MAILQSCCCWRSLRKGSYASAAYTTVYFSVTATIMGSFLHEERHYWSGNSTVPKSMSFLEPETISPTTMVFNIIVLSFATLGIITSVMLFYGLYSDNKILLIPWILTVVSGTMVDLAHSLYLFALETMRFNPMTAILFTLDFFVLSLNIYCLLCVVSQYQEYKAGRGTADFEFINRRVPGVRYKPQPTGTSFLSTRRAVTYHETPASLAESPTGNEKLPQRKHVQFGEEMMVRLVPPPPSVIHIESPKDSVSSDMNYRSGGSPSEEGNSSGEWPGANGKIIIDTEPLIAANLQQIASLPLKASM